MKHRHRDPLLRTALQAQRHLSRHARPAATALPAAVSPLLQRQRELESTWQLLLKVQGRSWHAAARQVRGRLFHHARLLQERLDDLRLLEDGPEHLQPTGHPPLLATIVLELQQLQREFDDVAIDPRRGLITVHTESLMLEDVRLGSFAIELHLERLVGRSIGAACFDCVALEPNCAAPDDSVTHPHVRQRSLCAGDAAVPIAQALADGRLADAFCLVRSVLRTYNPGSPYVHLSDWEGTTCPDCGLIVDEDDLRSCQACDNQCCTNCIGTCDACDDPVCSSCLEQDPVTHRDCCPDCRSTCSACGRVVEVDELDEKSGRCTGCGIHPSGDDPENNANDDNNNPSTQDVEHETTDDEQHAAPADASAPDVVRVGHDTGDGARGGDLRPADVAQAPVLSARG